MGTLHLTGPRGHSFTTVEVFLLQLPALLDAMAHDPRCFVVVAEFDDLRYVQFWVEPSGALIAEVISNRHLDAVQALSDDDEALLRAARWREPTGSANPNWWVEARGPNEIPELIEMATHAVRCVLGEGPTNRVMMRSWAMARDEESSDHVRREARVVYHDALRTLRRDLDGI
jgi:hypothetical protein